MLRLAFMTMLGTTLLTVACQKSISDQAPADPNAFRTFLMERMPSVLEETICQCCDKSLMQCYQETLGGEQKSCPDT